MWRWLYPWHRAPRPSNGRDAKEARKASEVHLQEAREKSKEARNVVNKFIHDVEVSLEARRQ